MGKIPWFPAKPAFPRRLENLEVQQKDEQAAAIPKWFYSWVSHMIPVILQQLLLVNVGYITSIHHYEAFLTMMYQYQPFISHYQSLIYPMITFFPPLYIPISKHCFHHLFFCDSIMIYSHTMVVYPLDGTH